MPSFISNYLSIAGSSVMLTIAATGIVYYLLGGRDFTWPRGMFWMVTGIGVIVAVIASAVLALIGSGLTSIPAIAGIGAGIGAAFVSRGRN